MPLTFLVPAILSGAIAAAASAAPASPALPPGQQLVYHCQWTQRYKMSTPWTGTMTIRVNDQGVVNGTYKSTSIKPDPFYGKIVTVTGGLSGDKIRLSFGISPAVSVSGDVFQNGISGVTTFNGGRFEFVAARSQ